MSSFDHRKYAAYQPVALTSRQWPDRVATAAPHWCSVDLRDGNQALIEPMTAGQKMRLYELLLAVGFKEIEVGFPAASSHDFEFVRQLIEQDLIPDDVTIQVLTQARDELIKKTFAALKGARRAIVHVYNSTSIVQREQVFGMNREGITAIAVHGAEVVRRCAAEQPETEWVFEYSPESFTGTELDFAVDICNAVNEVWQPTPEHKVILNLPATVEMSTPNIYADQIEWFCGRIERRDSVLISLHTHNDRGCAVAAAELGVLAGADRIEGTLMGNGERTGNMDIITMAMNLYSQGIDPKLDFSEMDHIVRTFTECTRIPVHPRHPYAGDLVFTAFSGSHQDAIKKCLAQRDEAEPWAVAYLPIDPADLGRSYQEVIRINSQSGKGGVAYVLERDYGIQLPRWLQMEFSGVVQRHAEVTEAEVSPEDIWALFQDSYLYPQQPYTLQGYELSRKESTDNLQVELLDGDRQVSAGGEGAGVVAAFIDAVQQVSGQTVALVEYSEHALSHTADAKAVSYIQLKIGGQRYAGVAISHDIVAASLNAILSGVNAATEKDRQAA
ncbi:MAG: 2-isopropylmalate synthase [Halieaceae bacterium]|jgi:2-isopropylmalate synthase